MYNSQQQARMCERRVTILQRSVASNMCTSPTGNDVKAWQRFRKEVRKFKDSRTCATASSKCASANERYRPHQKINSAQKRSYIAERSFCTRRQTASLPTRGTFYVSLVNTETDRNRFSTHVNPTKIWQCRFRRVFQLLARIRRTIVCNPVSICFNDIQD